MLSRLDPEARRLLRRVPFAGAAALFVWFAGGSEIYEKVLTVVTEKVLRIVETPSVTFLTWSSAENTVEIRRTDMSPSSPLPIFNPTAVAGNGVLLLALYLSTPGAATRRGFFGGVLAGAGLFASHVAHFGLAIHTIYATQLGAWSVYAYPRWQREVIASGRYFFDIALKFALPFVFWALFVLVPQLRQRDRDEAAANARAAEPQGTWRERRKQRKKR